MPTCERCGADLIDRRPEARFCSDNCRAKARAARRDLRLATAEELWHRQIEAIHAGDTDAVVDTIQEAERTLLG
ncbi:hypothetical protein N1027_10695 [Herbiconiux sp. CPCC 205763]|uniref:Uncharacterized protein n=1 Tax=Herbiconiux aconitum TaxID=2970913 RepID=A0ABT2GQU6_9MICO|nr:hypothetical protein [Herbiconiux aconitum]MCS5718601.1 hypothetical protein [Herbiconiux aconitum]